MAHKVTGFRPGSKSWKKFMAKVYGFGGAIVIVGAMFKIQHWPGAAIMLIGGLGIEAIIFILSAFEPLHEDPDWTLVYPELNAMDDDEEAAHHDHGHAELESGSEHSHEHAAIESAQGQVSYVAAPSAGLTAQLDSMLADAKIEPELISSLGEGLKNLAETSNKMNQLTDASVATSEYVDSVKSAAKTVDSLADSYVKASQSLSALAVTNEDGMSYGEQLQQVSKNLSSLNAVYELQLQGSNSQIESSQRMYESMNQMIQNLNDSIDDTKVYKENISELAKNLSALNMVYGNMLNAMSYNRS